MPSGDIAETLDRFFTEVAPLPAGAGLVVAFSGGPDSTALLTGLAAQWGGRRFDLLAAHFDHGLDDDSGGRAKAAARLAAELAVPLVVERATPSVSDRDSPRGMEDWARRERYAFLERQRRLHDAAFIVTAHHRNDQVETVLLRLLLGSGLEGLAGMAPVRGRIARPLLSLSRADLVEVVRLADLEPVLDPTNDVPDRPRTLVRHHLLPHLEVEIPGISERLAALAAASRAATERLTDHLAGHLDVQIHTAGASLDLEHMRTLPGALRPHALALLHRTAGLAYPPPAAARRELSRQLAQHGRIGCDCGGSWRWQSARDRLSLVRRVTPPERFTYTLQVPGEQEIPELGVRVSVRREEMAPWMLEGRPTRAALDLPLARGDEVIVRNRWPGDRIRPLGCRYSRRLKEVLIDRRIPVEERNRLPLLCLGGRIAWVPGVTVDDAYRLSPDSRPWVARIEPL